MAVKVTAKPLVSSASASINYDELGIDYRDWYALTPEERNDIISEHQNERMRMLNRYNAIANVYQTADSILTGASVDVRIADFSQFQNGEQTHAMTHNDGQTIYINEKHLGELTDESLLSLNGMNYHEVAHLLFTPRIGSEFMKSVVSEKLLPAFNILEDNRVDTFLSTRFPSVRESLTGSTLSALSGGKSEGAFLLTRGRRFLSVELRQASANAFIEAYGIDLAKQVADIIDEFRFLSLPTPSEAKRGLELIRKFADLLNLYGEGNSGQGGEGQGGESDSEGGQNQTGHNHNADVSDKSCSERLPMKAGRNESGKKQGQLSERAKASQGEAESLDGKGDTDGNESDNKSKEQDGTPDSKSGTPDSGDKDGSINESPASINEQLANLIDNAIKDVLNSSQTKQELQQVRKALRDVDTVTTGLSQARSNLWTVEQDYRTVSKAFADELIQLQIDSDPAWQRQVPSGKLNIQRTMNMDINDINILFDRWSEGSEAFDIEAVILMDSSGSMSGQIAEASKAVWTIKRSLESIDANVTVYTFDNDSKVLYKSDEKAKPSTYRCAYAGGSTDPYEALLETERILTMTRKKTKLVFIVSDGEWYREDKCEEIISRINDIDGAITSAVMIVGEWQMQRLTSGDSSDYFQECVRRWKHKCNTMTLVSKPRDIVKVARDVAKTLLTH
jgi:hypothetical protein